MLRTDKPAPRKEVLPTANLDNLTLDVLEAERLVYGCHYGNYKADHPHTKRAREEAVAAQKTPPPGWKRCKHCGRYFKPPRYKRGLLYCSDECRVEARNKRANEKRHQRKQQNEEANHVREE